VTPVPPDDRAGSILRRLRAPLAALLAITVLGTTGYRLLEGWSWLDSAWMVVITLTTIGYGEVHPLSEAGRVFTLVLIMGGVSFASWALSQAAGYAFSGDLQRDLRARQLRRRVQQLDGHYLVAGYGRTGREVAADLVHAGARVVVLESDPIGVVAAREDGMLVIEGDATSDTSLRRAGVERAAGLAATTASDAVNVFIVLSARQLNRTMRILARVDHAENESKARHAGADGVVRPHAIGGTTIAHALVRPGAADFVAKALTRAHPDLSVEDVRVRSDAFVGPLGALALRERFHVLVVAIQRADGTLEPTPGDDARVDPGDLVVVIGKPAAIARMRAAAERDA
jgi:voltage-gated potassium channel